MSNNKNKDNLDGIILTFIKEAFKLEWGTKGGKFNILFTSLIIILTLGYTAHDLGLTLIYAIFFHEKYPLLSFKAIVTLPVIWGGLCFLYMVFIVDKRYEIEKDLNKKMTNINRESENQ